MTTGRVDTFERWMRDVERRLARLERRQVQPGVAARLDALETALSGTAASDSIALSEEEENGA